MWPYAQPVLYAIFVWWLTTGVVLYLDGLPRWTFRWSLLSASALLIVSLYGLAASSELPSASGAFVAFTSGLFAWSWIELSFYLGVVTGPRRRRCVAGCSGWHHFRHAIAVSLYHELAILAMAGGIVALTWHGPNQFGTWTFLALWAMHQSARLNVFLGVRNLNEEFVPEHLDFLKSFLKKRSMNALFPISVTALTAAVGLLLQPALTAGADAFNATGFMLLATLTAVGLLEHWFLILPLPFAALWNGWLRLRGKGAQMDAGAQTVPVLSPPLQVAVRPARPSNR